MKRRMMVITTTTTMMVKKKRKIPTTYRKVDGRPIGSKRCCSLASSCICMDKILSHTFLLRN
jgi:hypothetical protein